MSSGSLKGDPEMGSVLPQRSKTPPVQVRLLQSGYRHLRDVVDGREVQGVPCTR